MKTQNIELYGQEIVILEKDYAESPLVFTAEPTPETNTRFDGMTMIVDEEYFFTLKKENEEDEMYGATIILDEGKIYLPKTRRTKMSLASGYIYDHIENGIAITKEYFIIGMLNEKQILNLLLDLKCTSGEMFSSELESFGKIEKEKQPKKKSKKKKK